MTNNPITSQVASGLVRGLFPLSVGSSISVHIQSLSFDSLEPTYSCVKATQLKTTITQAQEWNDHLIATEGVFAQLDEVSGIAPGDGRWHTSFDQYVGSLRGNSGFFTEVG